MKLARTTCNLCEAMCGLVIETDGREIGTIRGDDDDPLSHGHICPKAVALKDIYEDPDRLRAPLVKRDGSFVEVSWDEAFDVAAARLSAVRDAHGRNAVGLYLGNPNVHNLGSMLFMQNLTRALGSQNRFSATSVDQLPHHMASYQMFGHQFLIPIPDIDRTDYLVCLGANPFVSNGSLMTCPDFKGRVKELQDRGGRFVVVDPRRTRTAQGADEHLFIRPGTDAFFLLAIVHELFRLGVADLPDWVVGLDDLEEASRPFTPQLAEARTGIAADTIRRIAAEYRNAPTAAFYGRLGVSTQSFGGLCHWLINAINIISGNFDRPGGVLFTSPALDIVEPHRAGTFGRRHSRVEKLPEFAGEYPSTTMATEILTEGEGQIRAMVTVAGNPVLSVPGADDIDRAFSGLDAYVAIDIYLNETTRHADVILPPKTGLETEQYDVVFHHFAVRNTAKYSPPVVQTTNDQLADYEIFRGLATRLATDEHPFSDDDPMNVMTSEMALDFALQMGPKGLSIEDLADHPSGKDLGPLEPRCPDRLFTDDKTVRLAPPFFLDDLQRLASSVTDDGLVLIGRRHLRSNNSWMHNAPRLMKGSPRCTLLMHPADAEERGLKDGSTVRMSSAQGAVEILLEVSDEMMPGVVSAPHGWGHDATGIELAIASRTPGSNVNLVVVPSTRDELTGNAVLNGVPVDVHPI